MMIVLDTFPASSAGRRAGQAATLLDRCRRWLDDCEAAGHSIVVPAISYYEALREMEMRQAAGQIARLKAFCLDDKRFLRLTTDHLNLAAQIWGAARRAGRPTADRHDLDGDVILAAQVLSLGVGAPDIIVATTNPGHLSRYVPAELWTNIQP